MARYGDHPDSKFVVFEGIDGCGKSTQVSRTVEALISQGHKVTLIDSRNQDDIVNALYKIVTSKSYTDMLGVTEAFIFNAIRHHLVEKYIRPALKEPGYIICDRFTWSTIAYQGAQNGGEGQKVRDICNLATGYLEPHHTIYLDISVEESIWRTANDGPQDKFECDKSLLERTLDTYRDLIMLRHDGSISVISGTLDRDSITNLILDAIKITPKETEDR